MHSMQYSEQNIAEVEKQRLQYSNSEKAVILWFKYIDWIIGDLEF